MTPMHRARLAPLLAVVSGLLLAGCGDSGPPPAAPVAKVIVKGVFVSARDCSESGNGTVEACEGAIKAAEPSRKVASVRVPGMRQVMSDRQSSSFWSNVDPSKTA